MTTAYCYDKAYLQHTYAGHPENADRLRAIMDALEQDGLRERLTHLPPVPATVEQIARVHDRAHIGRVQRLAESGGGHLDKATYVTVHSFDTALLAAGGLLTLTRAVLAGEVRNGFALVRPPGHHAGAHQTTGFCVFNNVAVACRDALDHAEVERVLIMDIDVHHGNGTQEVFDSAPDVLFFSTHQFPFVPDMGWFDETGQGDGQGTVVNIPLPPGTGDNGYSQVLEEIVWPLARRFSPDLILVSAGFDAHWDDPLGTMALSLTGYAHISRQLVKMAEELCDSRLILSLEGGYNLQVLANAVQNTFFALLGEARVKDPLGPCPHEEKSVADRILEVRSAHGLVP
jgi:acetoin utilization deacetylase AcuC-like enzyme